MNLFGIGTGELVLILVIALLVLGPQRLPEFARQVARIIAQLRRVTDEFTQEINRELQLDDILREADPRQRPTPRSVPRPDPARTIAPPSPQPPQDYSEVPTSAAESPADESATAKPQSTDAGAGSDGIPPPEADDE